MRAPLAPIGWPRATAPPFTFTLSQSQSRALPLATTCAENASFTSSRSTSAIFMAARCSSSRIASAGASNSLAGSLATNLWSSITATGSRPIDRAASSRAMTRAAAPSDICEELPEVTDVWG